MSAPEQPAAYQVLARKYRPQTFAELIGQDALVRTLTNAIAHDRLHHGYMLTGVRGVGKTTTARIIAKALNCTAGDGPTAEPCGTCTDCVQIAEGRHIDVMELDAASRTGVDDMRELLEGVPYLPVQARRKIYIIDEVHMLSRSSFNALLKTLEEPPEHVIFIFATTEIRKVLPTVLSRCQRFDLKRVPPGLLIAHLDRVAKAEGVTLEAESLQLLARAADGSVRDSLSLLDQAIGHGAGAADTESVRDMLGLADRMRVLDLYDQTMRGEASAALTAVRALYDAGADPVQLLDDLLEITHWLSAERLAPGHEPADARAAGEREAAVALAEGLSMATLSRTWSILLKARGEASAAPAPIAAVEMAIIRLAHAAELPDPADLVRRLQNESAPPAPAAPTPSPGGSGGGSPRAVAAPAPAPDPQPDPRASLPQSFEAVVQLLDDAKEVRLLADVAQHVRLIDYSPGRLKIALAGDPPTNLTHRLSSFLEHQTGVRFPILVSTTETGAPTLDETRREREAEEQEARENDPFLLAVRAFFPKAQLIENRDLDTPDPASPDPDAEEDLT